MSAQPNVDAGEIRHNRMKLAMAVGDSRQYTIDSIVHDLGFEKCPLVGFRFVARFEQLQHLAHAGTAVRLVFAGWRDGERLAAIFLRQAQQPAVAAPQPIKPFDHKSALSGEFPDFRARGRQSEGRRQAHTKVFIFDALQSR